MSKPFAICVFFVLLAIVVAVLAPSNNVAVPMPVAAAARAAANCDMPHALQAMQDVAPYLKTADEPSWESGLGATTPTTGAGASRTRRQLARIQAVADGQDARDQAVRNLRAFLQSCK